MQQEIVKNKFEKSENLQQELQSRFSGGSTSRYKHPFTEVIYTEGVNYFINHCGNGAYWLLDIIATEIASIKEPFISIYLNVYNGEADILVTDGNTKELYKKHIDVTDAPDGVHVLWLTDGVLLLPCEY